jgi:hypothetical protein
MARRTLGWFLAVALSSAFTAPARAQPAEHEPVSAEAVASCAARHDEARLLRLNEQWLDARAAMIRCADASCPIAIGSDCSAWLEELAAVLPTLLVVIERDDAGTQPIRLEIDGKLREAPVDTGPLEMLPGKHRLRFTLETYPPVEHTLELEKGQKNRVVRVRFVREPLPAKGPAPAPPPREPERRRPIPPATYLAAAGAVAALASSGILLASALSSRQAARENCAPECRDGERQAIDQRLLAADIVGAAGLVLGGVAVYTYVTRPVVPDSGARTAPPSNQGALFGALVRGRF